MMSKAKALVEARLRWGKAAYIRFDKNALTDADKAPLRERLRALHAARTPENVNERQSLSSRILFNRCDVGEINVGAGIAMFSVRGSGDTWEEAFAKADRK